MTDRPLVSIVTPSWQRHELLTDTITDVRRQTYRPLEHIIVSDGPDHHLANLYHSDVLHDWDHGWENHIPLFYRELGRNWSSLLPNSFGIAPLTVGYLLARGEYLMPWCDDERAEPNHVERLVDALETTGADFAYSDVLFWRAGTSPQAGYVIGSDPPEMGTITNYLFRASLLQKAAPVFGTHPVDWALVRAWMAAGASWAYVPGVTFSHRADR